MARTRARHEVPRTPMSNRMSLSRLLGLWSYIGEVRSTAEGDSGCTHSPESIGLITLATCACTYPYGTLLGSLSGDIDPRFKALLEPSISVGNGNGLHLSRLHGLYPGGARGAHPSLSDVLPISLARGVPGGESPRLAIVVACTSPPAIVVGW